MVLNTEWAQVEMVELCSDGNGFGFNIVGGRSTGVVVKHVTPGGAAERDGRLQGGDHVLQAGDVNVRGFTSEQVAAVLRHAVSCGRLRLLVARPAEPTIDHQHLVPTKLLADPELLHHHLLQQVPLLNNNLEPTHALPEPIDTLPEPTYTQLEPIDTLPEPSDTLSEPIVTPDELPVPEVEIIKVELSKNVYGLGITVAGYVCEKEDLSGIFVKSIIEGSSAEASRKIKINDRIVEVDSISLVDKSNHQAVDILRNTGVCVHLVLERFLRGPRFEQLKLAVFSEPRIVSQPSSPAPSVDMALSWIPMESHATDVEPEPDSTTTVDSSVLEAPDPEPPPTSQDADLDEALELDPERLHELWTGEVGEGKEVIVVEVHKLAGLGISLEGTVEVEGGQEVRPRHFIRSVLAEGPVGRTGQLRAGDELLQVNARALHGLTHAQVVAELRALPPRVRLVCARDAFAPRSLVNLAPDRAGWEARCIIPGSLEEMRAPSPATSTSSATVTLECVARGALAMWESRESLVELDKAEQGLGFSILDYQDPVVAGGSVLVVRGLVPGGAAERGGRVAPGDRLLSVNGVDVRSAPLARAVHALKSAPRGLVRLGFARPRPLPPAPPHAS